MDTAVKSEKRAFGHEQVKRSDALVVLCLKGLLRANGTALQRLLGSSAVFCLREAKEAKAPGVAGASRGRAFAASAAAISRKRLVRLSEALCLRGDKAATASGVAGASPSQVH